jgi:hypothetical protein
MENKASDLSARLLATENLSVIRARTQTASFDIKSRVLTLPMWKDMTPEIEDMLIGHEVGHALYTLDQYIEPIKENPKMQSYLNVLEDVRIEKLIKRKYPGLRKKMNEGYMQLNERDFFGVKQVPSFDDLLLIDKINLYFKAGFQCGVTFTPEEKTFVNRAERTETVEEVIDLAKEVWQYSKEKAEERKERMKVENPQDSEVSEDEEDDQDPIEQDIDFDLDDEDWDQQEAEQEEEQKPVDNKQPQTQSDETKKEDDEPDLESKTERAFASKLEDLADESTEYIYWKFDDNYFEDPVIGYKKVINETKSPDQWSEEEIKAKDWVTRNMSDEERRKFYDSIRGDFDIFKTESSRTVNYLVKEFEMKKSAQMYKRAQVSKIGSLDMRKIYAYKLQDDLFKRVTTIPQGKNHGMVMLVDWSGSMNEVLIDTLKQVINLAMFCNRVQIPYRVFAFTSSYHDNIRENMTHDQFQDYHAARRDFAAKKFSTDKNMIDNTEGFNLLELFSSKMTTSEFNSMSKRVLDHRFQWNTGYATGGTPLNEALVWCYHNIGPYIKNSGIEKMTFITLTDGEGGSLRNYGGRYLEESRNVIVDGVYKRIKVKHLIRDDVTQKTYELERHSAMQTETILRMIKDRYDISVVGFHICENRRGNLTGVLHCNLPKFKGDAYSVIESWRKEFKQQGFASLKNTGRDELFLIPQDSTKIQEGEMDVKADANAKVIAKNFSKYLNVKKTSRILLNRFIALVA